MNLRLRFSIALARSGGGDGDSQLRCEEDIDGVPGVKDVTRDCGALVDDQRRQ